MFLSPWSWNKNTINAINITIKNIYINWLSIFRSGCRVLPVTHPDQACTPASCLGTGQVFVPERGSCPTSLEPSGGLLVKTEAQVRGMNAEPPYGGSDLGKILKRQRWTSLRRRS